MGFVRIFVISSTLCLAAVLVGVIPANLPHPACHHVVRPWRLKEKPGVLEGDYRPNTALQSAKRLLEGQMRSSESIAITPSGDRVFLGDRFGWIHAGRLTPQGEIELDKGSPYIQVPGRPLGLHALSDSTLLVCDAVAGLLEINVTEKSYTVLTDSAKSERRKRTAKIVYANDLDVSPDGVVYFSDSTDIPVDKGTEGYYSTLRTYVLNLLEGGATGRLLSYDRESNTTKELMGQLFYANGVAVAQDGSFVAVVETNAFRVHRYWLKGPRAGTSDILIEQLPGTPDGISVAPDGNFWIALLTPVPSFWPLLPYRGVRLTLAWLTEYVSTPVPSWGYVMKISPKGEVLTVLSDLEGGFIRSVSSVTEHQGKLFLGNLVGDYISVFDLALLKGTASEELPKEEL